jgi:hypothetical protein
MLFNIFLMKQQEDYVWSTKKIIKFIEITIKSSKYHNQLDDISALFLNENLLFISNDYFISISFKYVTMQQIITTTIKWF